MGEAHSGSHRSLSRPPQGTSPLGLGRQRPALQAVSSCCLAPRGSPPASVPPLYHTQGTPAQASSSPAPRTTPQTQPLKHTPNNGLGPAVLVGSRAGPAPTAESTPGAQGPWGRWGLCRQSHREEPGQAAGLEGLYSSNDVHLIWHFVQISPPPRYLMSFQTGCDARRAGLLRGHEARPQPATDMGWEGQGFQAHGWKWQRALDGGGQASR